MSAAGKRAKVQAHGTALNAAGKQAASAAPKARHAVSLTYYQQVLAWVQHQAQVSHCKATGQGWHAHAFQNQQRPCARCWSGSGGCWGSAWAASRQLQLWAV